MENTQDRTRRQRDRILFIHQDPDQPTSTRTIVSHARRWQIDQRRQGLQASASQAAGYARSLVGWRSRDDSNAATHGEGTGIPLQGNIDEDPASDVPLTMLQLAGGLRVDPFNALPTEQNRDLMFTTDYFIHVWVYLKATQLDTFLGFNTYLTLCWPIALQDDMLFHATLANSRSAWCLSQRIQPADDQFVLHHRGAAISRLRQRLSEESQAASESVLFTMDYMINVSYMTHDHSAFDVHLTAFKHLADGYTTLRSNDVTADVVSHRLKSWEALGAYRKGVDPLRQNLQPVSHGRNSLQPTYIYDSLSWHQTGILGTASPGFVELVHSGLICVELAEASVRLGQLLVAPSHSRATAQTTQLLKQILLWERLTNFESRIGYALLALCFYLDHVIDPDSQSTTAQTGLSLLGEQILPEQANERDMVDLDTIAKAYLNKQVEPQPPSELIRRSITWCSLVVGSVALHFDHNAQVELPDGFLRQRLRAKGHIIILAAAPHLIHEEDATWSALDVEALVEQFLGTVEFADLWRRSWEATVRRQREWRERGWLDVGAPMNEAQGGEEAGQSFDVEYMVLREERDSLPQI